MGTRHSNGHRWRRTVGAAAAILLVAGASACSGDDSTEALEQELADLTAERDALALQAEEQAAKDLAKLGEMTAERDALALQAEERAAAERDAPAQQAEERAERREKGIAIQAEIKAILDDPESFGTEEEVADLLATHATQFAAMDDEVFGSANYRAGFYNTLYSNAMDAEIDVYETWMSDDGSQGGVLWMWHGTNARGNPFELAGVSITTHDEDGMITHEYVTYPHDDAYVVSAAYGLGTCQSDDL